MIQHHRLLNYLIKAFTDHEGAPENAFEIMSHGDTNYDILER